MGFIYCPFVILCHCYHVQSIYSRPPSRSFHKHVNIDMNISQEHNELSDHSLHVFFIWSVSLNWFVSFMNIIAAGFVSVVSLRLCCGCSVSVQSFCACFLFLRPFCPFVVVLAYLCNHLNCVFFCYSVVILSFCDCFAYLFNHFAYL